MSEAVASATARAAHAASSRAFGWILLSQVLSLSGAALTAFGVGVWVFQQSGSVLNYALLVACIAAPAVVVAPWAGAWVDRFDRRLVMLVANSGAALCTAAIGLLLWLGRLDVWGMLLFNAVAAVCQAFQRPAFLAAVTTLQPKGELGRASGMVQLVYAVPSLIAPLLAAFLLAAIGLPGIIVLDLAGFAVATGVLLLVRMPCAVAPDRRVSERRRPLQEFGEMLGTIRQRRPLCLLLGYFALERFLVCMVVVLFTPIVLALYSEAVLGSVSTIAGVGMLLGSMLMSAWGGPRRRILGILAFDLLLGTAVLIGGVWTSVPLMGACAFVVMFCGSVVSACDQTLWRHKVAPALQGRLFALREVIINTATPLSALVGGLLAQHFFEPWMMPGGWLADSVGAWTGVGQGRGIGLMFGMAGVLTIVLALAGLLHPAMRQLEREIPDAH